MFAVERIDTWVFRVGIAVPVVCIVGLAIWHLSSYLIRKQPRRTPTPSKPSAPSEPTNATAPRKDDPARLQRACAALEQSLAESYLELAECWLRRGQTQQAIDAWQRLVHICPEAPQAEEARDRLRRLGVAL